MKKDSNLGRQILVLEGIPASGKTSLANFLRDEYGAKKVNESLGVLAAHSGNQKAIFLETIERYQKASRETGLVVLDRGYPSLLAWDYCREKTGYAHDLAEKKEWVADALAQGKLFEPDYYVYLEASPGLSFARRPRQVDPQDAWSDSRGVHDCLEFYHAFFGSYESKAKVLDFYAKTSTREIAKQIMQRIVSST